MVSSVTRVPRTRTLQEPIARLCDRLRAELQSISPGHVELNRMTDAFTADRLEDAIAEVRATRMAGPQRSELVERLQSAYWDKLTRYHRAWMAWRFNRAKANRIDGSPSQQLMALLPHRWQERDFPQVSMNISDVPIFVTFEEAKKANDALELQVYEIEAFNKSLDDALGFANQPTDIRAELMCEKLFEVVKALCTRIERLENAIKPRKVA